LGNPFLTSGGSVRGDVASVNPRVLTDDAIATTVCAALRESDFSGIDFKAYGELIGDEDKVPAAVEEERKT
jgi:hypothetical protein